MDEPLAALPKFDAPASDIIGATGTDNATLSTLIMDNCLAQSGTSDETSMDADGRRTGKVSAGHSPENTDETHDSLEENAMRPDGFEPSTYGLGNRRSIP